MATENVKKFFDEVSKNEDLQKKLTAATEQTSAAVKEAVRAQAESVVEVAKAAGFDFSAEELFEASVSGDEKLNLNDLDAVAGGGGGQRSIDMAAEQMQRLGFNQEMFIYALASEVRPKPNYFS